MSNKSVQKKYTLEQIKQAKYDKDLRNNILLSHIEKAKRIASHYVVEGLEFEDLVQEGLLGIIDAIENYSTPKGRFSNYEYRQIENFITKAVIQKSSFINLPAYRLRNSKQKREIEEIEKMNSLNQVIEEKRKNEILDFIGITKDIDNDIDTIIDRVDDEIFLKILEEIIGPRNLDIIKYYIGLIDGKKYSYKEIGKIYNVSANTIRQIIMEGFSFFEITKNTRYYNKKNMLEENSNIATQQLFDIHHIDQNMTFYILKKLLQIFPERDMKLYINYRGINLEQDFIFPVKARQYSHNILKYINFIENDLRFMFSYYKYIVKMKNISDEDIINIIKFKMTSISIRFHFPDYTQKEILEAVKMLSSYNQNIIFQNYGYHLMRRCKFKNIEEKNKMNDLYMEIGEILKEKKEAIIRH